MRKQLQGGSFVHTSISIVVLISFLFNNIMPAAIGRACLETIEAREAYAAIVESMENTCPSDPTQNGKCALIDTKADGPSCRTIAGQQICKDWWRKDFTYKCSGSFDPDTILEKVGNQYCDYKNECAKWQDVSKDGGDVSCRIYVDVNRPGCSGESFSYDCVVNDCGDLFDRCSMKQYIRYSDIPDRANLLGDVNCDTHSWMCGSRIAGSSVSGIKLGLYTFSCPSEVRNICKSYSGKVKCPDGSEQVCNRVRTCKNQKTVDQRTYELKSCIANRDMQSYSYLKGSADADALRSNSMCIKTGEKDACTQNAGCADSGSYGVGYFYRNGPDWGYVEMWGVDAASKTFRIHAYAAGGLGECGDIDLNMSSDTPPGATIGTVYPHWEGSCRETPVTYEGYQCSGGCIHTFKFHSPYGVFTANVPVSKTDENFNCYQNSYQDCSFGGGLGCRRLSSSDVNELECSEYDSDADSSAKVQCKRYLVNYECPKERQVTECAEYDEVLKCNDGIYPIRDVRTDSYDFSADFTKAAALAQATNELKHVWSGEPYRCESGTWWLFSTQSLGDYFLSKVTSFALSQLGSHVFEQVSTMISEATTACINPLFDNFVGKFSGNTMDRSAIIQDGPTNTRVVECTKSWTKDGASGLMQNFGLTADQANSVLNFLGNPFVQFGIGIVFDVVTLSFVDNLAIITPYMLMPFLMHSVPLSHPA